VEQAKLATLDAAEKTKDRIENLKMEERDLGIEFEELEKQIFLMEKFIVAKVGLLEGKINSKFQLARFKLFETQINEGIDNKSTRKLYLGTNITERLQDIQNSLQLDAVNLISGMRKPTRRRSWLMSSRTSALGVLRN
ncbi:hypothetical protein LCGC14_1892130, partial [marine sediment metagenome]